VGTVTAGIVRPSMESYIAATIIQGSMVHQSAGAVVVPWDSDVCGCPSVTTDRPSGLIRRLN